MFEYEIGGKTYIQKALVWAQLRQLVNLTKGIEFPSELTVPILLGLLGDKIPSALAIVLTEQGKSPKDKNLDELAIEIDENITIDMAFKVVEDFFGCNPTASILEKLTGVLGQLNPRMKEVTTTTSTELNSSLPEETSQEETQ